MTTAGMSKAIAIAIDAAQDRAEWLRRALVWGCAAALILAGPALPF